jgi:hypothetical protein
MEVYSFLSIDGIVHLLVAKSCMQGPKSRAYGPIVIILV